MSRLANWFQSRKSHPEHGDEVLTYRVDRGQILIGWWDKEINGFVVYGANGTHKDAPDFWSYLPRKPLGFIPSEEAEAIGSADHEREAEMRGESREERIRGLQEGAAMTTTTYQCCVCGSAFEYEHGGSRGYSYDPPMCGAFCNGKKVGREEVHAAYNELIMAVGNRYEGETRLQTALRYIRQAEERDGRTGDNAKANP